MNKTCELCGKSFKTSISKQMFCSRSCASIVKANKKKKGKTYYNRKCVFCNKAIRTVDKRIRFCSKRCASKHNNRNREPMTEEQKKKISESLKRLYKLHPEKIRKGDKAAKAIIEHTRGKYREQIPERMLELSHRTAGKILKRLKIGCSMCGWDKSTCDLHHINGKKIADCDNHKNLTYVCPNCHRMIHNKVIPIEEVINLKDYIGDRWKEFYYG